MDKPEKFEGDDIGKDSIEFSDGKTWADKSCMENKFQQKDAAKVIELTSSNAATDEWYSGIE